MLNEPFVAEKPPSHRRNSHGNNHGEDETPGFFFHAIDEVQTEHRRDECGNHHDDGDGGQCTHHRIHVVINDAGVSVHRRFQNVRIDAGRLAGL